MAAIIVRAPAWPYGANVGGFEPLWSLGSGGQGTVYLARPWQASATRRRQVRLWLRACHATGVLGQAQARRWRLAALKLAHSGQGDSLHDEHAHLAALGMAHPHLALLYTRRFAATAPRSDLGFAIVPGEAGWRPYLVLAYEAGENLADLLTRRRAPLMLNWSLTVAVQVAQALVHLHGRGIVHHDVRPANVLLRATRKGQPPDCVLLDLGAAETPARPRRRAIYGVDGWLAPERIGSNPAPANPLVDIFGLGALLRELTAGKALSPALGALIQDAMAPDPSQRGAHVPNMQAMLVRLQALSEYEG